MESMCQALGAIYVALAVASGGNGTLRRANNILADAVNDGCIKDPEARRTILELVRACREDHAETA